MSSARSLLWAVCIGLALAWPGDLPGHGIRASEFYKAAPRDTATPADNPFDISQLQFIPASPNDRRGPCPGLNVAANMGVLPRSGKNISQPMLSKAVQDLYNLDKLNADAIAYGITLVVPSRATDQSISLEDLQRHGAIEHDASITRLDYRQGDQVHPNRELFDKFMADGDGEFITLPSMAKTRTRRSQESRDGGSPGLGLQDQVAAYGEASIILNIFGYLGQPGKPGYYAPKRMLQQWMLEERLPDGWTRPKEAVSLSKIISTGVKILAVQELGGYADYIPESIIG